MTKAEQLAALIQQYEQDAHELRRLKASQRDLLPLIASLRDDVLAEADALAVGAPLGPRP